MKKDYPDKIVDTEIKKVLNDNNKKKEKPEKKKKNIKMGSFNSHILRLLKIK